MMIVTTLLLALVILAMLYFVAIRNIPWPTLSYALMTGVGLICLMQGDVHFRYIGNES